MRTDFDRMTAEAFVSLLKANVSAEIQATCPIVSVFDLMELDDASRIIVEASKAQTWGIGGNATVQILIGIRSNWSQPSVEEDEQTHQSRINAVMETIRDDAVIDSLATHSDPNLGIVFISPESSEESRVMDNGWYHTILGYTVETYLKQEET